MSKKKIIKILLIILAIIILIFLFDLGRKTYILSKYTNENNKYAEITNFYKKMTPEEGVTTEFWRKGNLGLLKRTAKDDIKMIYYGEEYNWIIIDSKEKANNETKIAVKMNKEGPGIEVQNLKTGTLDLENFWNTIKMAFLSRITTEKLSDIECYKFYLNEEWQMFVNKDNFLVMREKNGSTDTGTIEYKLNVVRDEDVVMPNLAGYSINDTTQKQ